MSLLVCIVHFYIQWVLFFAQTTIDKDKFALFNQFTLQFFQ